MSQSGFTPIQIYRSSTAAAVPLAANLAAGELAINTTDEKLYFENASGVVKLLASSAFVGTVTSVGLSGGTTGLTVSGTNPITSSGTFTLGGTLAVANGGTGVTSSTGTVAVVLSNTPTLVTPILGAATATSVANGLGLVGTPSYTFTGDLNTGMWSPAADTIAFSEGGVEAMRISSSGDVGIGTTAPAYRLDVKPAAYSAGTALVAAVNINYNAGVGSGNTSCGALTWEGTGSTRLASINPFVEDPSATSKVSMAFSTSDTGGTNTERMRITGTGLVGIGTSAPAYQLQLSTDSAAKPTSALWTIASDSRIKTETGEYTKGLDAVCALRPITYHYNGVAGFVDDGKENISIIAQEAMQHFPECVGTFEMLLNEGDEEKTELFNWNGHALIFALVNAVKELNAVNDALTARVAQLEGNQP
jgi:hypothetical protein